MIINNATGYQPKVTLKNQVSSKYSFGKFPPQKKKGVTLSETGAL